MTEDCCGRNVIFDLDSNLRRPKFDEKHKKILLILMRLELRTYGMQKGNLYHWANVSSEEVKEKMLTIFFYAKFGHSMPKNW